MAASDDELLDAAARDGSLDAAKWPGLLEQVLKRFDHIVYHEFPIPVIPPPPPPEVEPDLDEAGASETPRSPATQPTQPIGENADASATVPDTSSPEVTARSTPPPASSTVPASTPIVIPNSQPSTETPARPNESTSDGTLPAVVLATYHGIQSSLRAGFATAPPFTIQRLAELIRRPKQHYRTLPAYLRAVDRAVAVASPSTVFPLPPIATADASLEGSSTYLAGGAAATGGMHDDFNAAALTRIPWLTEAAANAGANAMATTTTATTAAAAGETSNGAGAGGAPRTTELQTARTEQIDGPHGAGSVETVTVGGTHGSSSGGFVGFGAGGGGRAASQHKPELTETPTLRSNAEPLSLGTESETASQTAQTHKRTRGSSPQPGKAGTAAAAGGSSPNSSTSGPGVTVTSPPEDKDKDKDMPPHARGPEEIGMADMGPQVTSHASGHVFDAEAALGRPGEAETLPGSPTAMVRSPRPESLPDPLELPELGAPDAVMEDQGEGEVKKEDAKGKDEGEDEKMEVEKATETDKEKETMAVDENEENGQDKCTGKGEGGA